MTESILLSYHCSELTAKYVPTITTDENAKQTYRMGHLVYWTDREKYGKLKISYTVGQKEMLSNDSSLLWKYLNEC